MAKLSKASFKNTIYIVRAGRSPDKKFKSLMEAKKYVKKFPIGTINKQEAIFDWV